MSEKSRNRLPMRWGVTALVTLLTGGGAVLAGAGPAAAADPTCTPTRTVCLWDQTDFAGTRFTVQANDPVAGTCVNLVSHGWGSGRTRSAKNTGTQVARLYQSQSCTGDWYQLIPGGNYTPVNFASNSIYVF
jgi:hypothetical protein